MKRDSPRELATDIENLSETTAAQPDEPTHTVVYEHPDTGDWYDNQDCAGAPLDDEDIDAWDMVIVLNAAYTGGDIDA